MAPTVYLISGANRGIGFGLVQHLVARDNVVVFAGARDPDAATDLHELADRIQGKLHIVKLISADEANNRAAVETIKSIAGRLDVVIANAGASGENTKTILGVSLEDMMYQFTVNTLGPLALIQATYPLLKASTSVPKFVAISSRCGSITTGAPLSLPQAEPGTSKCALNWMIKKLWHENPDLITFAMCPGMIATEGATRALEPHTEFLEVLKSMGFKRASVEDGTRLVLQQIDKATRETHAFISEKGESLPW